MMPEAAPIYPVLRHRRSGKLLVGPLRYAITADPDTSRGLLHLFGGGRRVKASNVVLVGCAKQFGFRSYDVAWCDPKLAWCQGVPTVEAKPADWRSKVVVGALGGMRDA